jgi:hypothetical protein
LFGGCPSLDCNLETEPPPLLPTKPGTFTQAFSAYWYTLLWPVPTETTCSPYGDLSIEISCAEGAIITFQEATMDSVSCQKMAGNVLCCLDYGDVQGFVFRPSNDNYNLSGVFYQCSGNSLVGTTATAEDSEASCNVVADGMFYSFHLAIATLCKDSYVSSGAFLECPVTEG